MGARSRMLAASVGGLLLLGGCGGGSGSGSARPTTSTTGAGTVASVFLRLDATPEQREAIRQQLLAMAEVTVMGFVDQDAAYQEFTTMFAGSPDLVAAVSPADLPSSFRVTVSDMPVEALAGRLADVPGVKAVVPTRDDAARRPPPLDRVVRPTA